MTAHHPVPAMRQAASTTALFMMEHWIVINEGGV